MERVPLKGSNPHPAVNAVQWMVAQHKVPTNGLYAEVECKINGVEVPFTVMCEAFSGNLDMKVRRAALEMLEADPALRDLRLILVRAKMDIRAAVSQLPHVPDEEVVHEEIVL